MRKATNVDYRAFPEGGGIPNLLPISVTESDPRAGICQEGWGMQSQESRNDTIRMITAKDTLAALRGDLKTVGSDLEDTEQC
jgi:hypothetical protein